MEGSFRLFWRRECQKMTPRKFRNCHPFFTPGRVPHEGLSGSFYSGFEKICHVAVLAFATSKMASR